MASAAASSKLTSIALLSLQLRLLVVILSNHLPIAVCVVQVVAALSAACGLLLIRTVFGLLSIDHPKFTNQPRLLYTLEALPELLALYIVAAPGFMPAVGRDADQQQRKPAVQPAGAALQSENVPV